MCDLLIPALLIAGAAVAIGGLGCNNVCEPVCAPQAAVCAPQTTYAASYSAPSCAPAFTTVARYDSKVAGVDQRGVPMVNADNRYGANRAAHQGY